MPTSIDMTVDPNDLRRGDFLVDHGHSLANPKPSALRGKRKGWRVWHLEGGPAGDGFAFDPVVPVKIVRTVPTAAEREAYIAAARDFHDLTSLVQMGQDAVKAVKQVIAYAEKALEVPLYESLSRTAFGQSPGEAEALLGRYRATYAARYRMLKSMGIDQEALAKMVDSSILADGDLFDRCPSKPRNSACYGDGTPAPRTALRFDTAPYERPQADA